MPFALRMTTAAACAVLVAAFTVRVHAEALPRATPESVGMSSQRLARIAAALKADIDQGRCPAP